MLLNLIFELQPQRGTYQLWGKTRRAHQETIPAGEPVFFPTDAAEVIIGATHSTEESPEQPRKDEDSLPEAMEEGVSIQAYTIFTKIQNLLNRVDSHGNIIPQWRRRTTVCSVTFRNKTLKKKEKTEGHSIK